MPAHLFSAWSDFYVIVGSSGAALIGLQFVVMTLIAGRRPGIATGSVGAFGTPTVVHLGGALVVSAVMSAPWPSTTGPAVVLAACGLGGLAYGVDVVRRARAQTTYRPVWEDWLWHVALPCVVYAAIATAAPLLAHGGTALFVVAAAALALLLIGIHNAWDTVTYIVARPRGEDAQSRPVTGRRPRRSRPRRIASAGPREGSRVGDRSVSR